ncbi:uncharacterized protein LOC111307756 isoform X2 [Durio zibethinus]|uniref:Uncharacterized protein LOC111307756 isoform X2 n=1 Tax=Durio zibethinus TaxID=66656 RepID=A0A6P6AA66_DURZI|nr:uncharacterized protein LOC111307756 isoform X2 [Durio zibethinus]
MATTSKSKKQIAGEKKIVIVEGRHPQKMVGSSVAEAALTEATNQHKQTGRKRERTEAQRIAHRATCRKFRLKEKGRRTELKKMETEYFEMVPKFEKMNSENQRLKMELEESISENERRRKEIEGLKRTLEEQGQSISILNKYVELFASQTFEPVSDYPNITASSAVSSLGANPDFSSLFDAQNDNRLSLPAAPNNYLGDGAGYSSGANHNFSNVSDAFAPNCHNNIVDSATGVGAVSFSDYLLDVVDVPNLPGNIGSFTNDPADGVGTSFVEDSLNVDDDPNLHDNAGPFIDGPPAGN